MTEASRRALLVGTGMVLFAPRSPKPHAYPAPHRDGPRFDRIHFKGAAGAPAALFSPGSAGHGKVFTELGHHIQARGYHGQLGVREQGQAVAGLGESIQNSSAAGDLAASHQEVQIMAESWARMSRPTEQGRVPPVRRHCETLQRNAR